MFLSWFLRSHSKFDALKNHLPRNHPLKFGLQNREHLRLDYVEGQENLFIETWGKWRRINWKLRVWQFPLCCKFGKSWRARFFETPHFRPSASSINSWTHKHNFWITLTSYLPFFDIHTCSSTVESQHTLFSTVWICLRSYHPRIPAIGAPWSETNDRRQSTVSPKTSRTRRTMKGTTNILPAANDFSHDYRCSNKPTTRRPLNQWLGSRQDWSTELTQRMNHNPLIGLDINRRHIKNA